MPGSTPAAAGAALAMVVRILSRIISSQGRWRAFADAKLLTIVLLAGPWVVWIAFIVAGVVLSLEDQTIVHKAIFYATIEHDALNLWSSIICAIFEVAVLTLEAVAATILIRHWRAFRALSHSSTRLDDLASYPDPPQLSSSQPVSTTAPTTGGRKTTLRGAGRTARFADRFEGVNLGLVFRVGFFGLLVLMALIVAVLVVRLNGLSKDVTPSGHAVDHTFCSTCTSTRLTFLRVRPATLPSLLSRRPSLYSSPRKVCNHGSH